jgi:hypothetical protein
MSFQLTYSMLLYSSLWSTWWEKWYHDLWTQGLHKFYYQENDLKIRKLKCLFKWLSINLDTTSSKLNINGLDGILGFIIESFYYNISFVITNVYV